MVRFVIAVLMIPLLFGHVVAKCINLKHVQLKVVIKDGQRKESYRYPCMVKATEAEHFDAGYCKNCGCHVIDHDNM